jgi:23S rRNA (pseudouridine1915-N3)-methyltransferase
MLGITFLCVGKMREKHYIAAFEEYRKRLGAFCRFELVELPEARLPDVPSQREIEAALEREAREIEKRVPQGAFLVAMCIEGRQHSSEELAALLQHAAGSGKSRICFLIGGSFGLHEDLKGRADLRLSMSKMTFPHHLARVMLAEQVYRGFMINQNTKYHK